MRYIMIILLIFSLPTMASTVSPSKDTHDTAKALQQKIQKKIGKNVCDPEKELHMGQFN